MRTCEIIGYIRINNCGKRGEEQLKGIKLDKLYTENTTLKCIERPQLESLISYVSQGDIVVVNSMDRIFRNLHDLRRLALVLIEKGVSIKFIKEKLTFSAEDSPMTNLVLSIIGSLADFERALIRERQINGIAIAKKQGLYKGRKPSLTEAQIKEIMQRAKTGEAKTKIARDFGICRDTLYKYLKRNSS